MCFDCGQHCKALCASTQDSIGEGAAPLCPSRCCLCALYSVLCTMCSARCTLHSVLPLVGLSLTLFCLSRCVASQVKYKKGFKTPYQLERLKSCLLTSAFDIDGAYTVHADCLMAQFGVQSDFMAALHKRAVSRAGDSTVERSKLQVIQLHEQGRVVVPDTDSSKTQLQYLASIGDKDQVLVVLPQYGGSHPCALWEAIQHHSFQVEGSAQAFYPSKSEQCWQNKGQAWPRTWRFVPLGLQVLRCN